MAEAPVPANLEDPSVQESLAALDRAAPLLSLLGVASDGLTDTMVERTVSNLTRTSMLLDRLTSPGVEQLVDKLADPQVAQTLGGLLDRAEQAHGLLAALGAFGDGMTDSMLERTVSNLTRASLLLDRLTGPGVEGLIGQLSDPKVAEGLGGLLGRLEQLQDVLAAVGAFSDGLTDTMVERTVSNLTRASLLLDRLTSPGVERLIGQLSDPKVADGLGGVLERTEQLQGLLGAIGAFNDGLTDTMVERTVSNLTRASLLLDRLTGPAVEGLIGQLSDPKVADGLGGLLERTEQLQGLLGAIGAFNDGLTDTMIERTVGNVTHISLLLDRLTAPEGESLVEGLLGAGPALEVVLQRLSDLEANGRLQRMLELLDLLGVLADSLTEPMLERMIAFMTGLMEMASDSGGLTSQLRRISQEATAEAQRDTRQMGLLAMIGGMKDPEVQQGLKVVLALAKRIPQVLDRS